MKTLNVPNEVFKKTARLYLERQQPRPPRFVIDDILEKSDVSINALTNDVGGYIDAALSALGRYVHEALDEDLEDISGLRNAIEKHRCYIEAEDGLEESREIAGGIVCIALRGVYDYRIKRNADQFFEPTTTTKDQMIFLPPELIGFASFYKCITYVEPLMEALGIPIDVKYIKKAYIEKMQRKYFIENGINSRNALETHIRNIQYATPESILTVIRHYRWQMTALISLIEDNSHMPWHMGVAI